MARSPEVRYFSTPKPTDVALEKRKRRLKTLGQQTEGFYSKPLDYRPGSESVLARTLRQKLIHNAHVERVHWDATVDVVYPVKYKSGERLGVAHRISPEALTNPRRK